MKRLLVVIGVLLIVAALAYARAPKDYQVTGPVLEMDGDHIIVQKGKDERLVILCLRESRCSRRCQRTCLLRAL